LVPGLEVQEGDRDLKDLVDKKHEKLHKEKLACNSHKLPQTAINCYIVLLLTDFISRFVVPEISNQSRGLLKYLDLKKIPFGTKINIVHFVASL